MASDGSTAEPQAAAKPAAPTRRPMSRRRRRNLVIAIIVVAVALVIVFWGWSATGQEFMQVSSLVDQFNISGTLPSQNVNRTLEIQGTVSGWNGSISDHEFQLVDRGDSSKWINVTMSSAYPSGFEDNKAVVVTGTFADASELKLTATKVTVGCASKY